MMNYDNDVQNIRCVCVITIEFYILLSIISIDRNFIDKFFVFFFAVVAVVVVGSSMDIFLVFLSYDVGIYHAYN